MKRNVLKRIFATALAFGMAFSLAPETAFAAQNVTSNPGNKSIPVEYFNSTVYNWNEDEANKATAAADRKSTVSWTSRSVSYSSSNNYSTYTNGNYYVKVGDAYKKVTNISCSRTNRKYNWTITYEGGSTTSTNSSITLYTQTTTSGSQEGKGFYFTSGGNKPSDNSIPGFSKWDGTKENPSDTNSPAKQNWQIYSGLAAGKLNESSNAPFNNDTVNAANLFATDGSNTAYTDVYKNVKVPFVYDQKTGYYTLDSDTNAVYFANGKTGASDGATMKIADKPAVYNSPADWLNDYGAGFAPFNALASTTRAGNKSVGGTVTGYDISGSMVYGFGMVTEVPFQMTDDGKDAKGNDIEFKFSGDDDVWVYVDDTLVLDIGGTHDAIQGTVNFATGDVKLVAPAYNYIGDKRTGESHTKTEGMTQTNLYTALGTTLTGFAAQGQHKLKIYYMDRGRGRTNCLIQFNLPQKDSVSITKNIANTYTGTDIQISDDVMATLNNVDFSFTAYKRDDNKNYVVVPNRGYTLYDSSNTMIGTGSTDANGVLKLKNGQTAMFRNISLDSEESYYIVENVPEGGRWTANWSATSSIANAKIENGNGATSGKVTATGSSTATDTISFVCTNSYKYESGLDVDANDETIVLDYGLPVEVDVLANDSITNNGANYTNYTLTLGDSFESKYGTAESKNNKIVYTLTKQLNGIETIPYTITATDSTDGSTKSASATLTVIPATSMYYEENFSDMISYSKNAIKWEEQGTALGTYQETGLVGTASDSTYGTDSVYLNNLGDSYGTSRYAHAVNYAAQFSYDFTGTGTAIYSRIAPTSGYIQVLIKDTNGAEVERQYIDTRIIGNVATNKTLYNIPVYNRSDLEYGTYKVTVTLYKEGTKVKGFNDSEGNYVAGSEKSGADFYLDGIQVYQPLIGDDTANSAYATDGEANIALINIREKIAADDEEGWSNDDIFTLTDIDGNISDVDTYTSIGPNEELYLTNSATQVSFTLVNWDTQTYKLYLGMKAPDGKAAAVQIGDQQISLNNSADCYYDISPYVTVEWYDLDEDGTEETEVGTVTITGISGLVSLTNIKVTGTDQFSLGYGGDLEADGADSASLFMVPANYFKKDENAGGEEVTTPEEPDTEVTTPEEPDTEVTTPEEPDTEVTTPEEPDTEVTEPEVQTFVPESIKTNCGYASKTKKSTVTVVTSYDVAYMTFNGERVEPINANNAYKYSRSYTKVAVGTVFELVAYNSDGVASAVYTVTAE